MITAEQFQEMLDMQEKLEERIDGKDWRTKGHRYELCIFMECAEIIDHFSWKHWKDTETKAIDMTAVHMEIVDVWHFMQAYLLQVTNPTGQDVLETCLDAIEYNTDVPFDLEEIVVGLALNTYVEDAVSFGNLIILMRELNMTFEDLYRLYIIKNVLNWFRQDNGYKEGRYKKKWNDLEDNEHATQLAELLGDELNMNTMYKSLSDSYHA